MPSRSFRRQSAGTFLSPLPFAPAIDTDVVAWTGDLVLRHFQTPVCGPIGCSDDSAHAIASKTSLEEQKFDPCIAQRAKQPQVLENRTALRPELPIEETLPNPPHIGLLVNVATRGASDHHAASAMRYSRSKILSPQPPLRWS